MDGNGDDIKGWIADGVAAGLLGAGVGTSLLLLGMAGTAVGAAPVAVLLALAMLRRVKPAPRRFRLPAFTVERHAVAAPDELLLSEIAADAPEEEEELVLEDRLPEPDADSRVVQLFASRPLPTPGELARRIEHHLGNGEVRDGKVLELEVDAAAALRQALGDLRRNLA